LIDPQRGLSYDDVLIVPKCSAIKSRKDVDTSVQLTKKIKLKVPIISANMDTITEHAMAIAMAEVGGLGIIHRFLSIEDEAGEVLKVKKAGHKVGAAIGVGEGWRQRARALVMCGVDLLVIDVAHGHHESVLDVIKGLKDKYPDTPIMAGNVVTMTASADLHQAGAEVIKVGVGPGSMCTTRLVTGVGVPQLTAIEMCSGWGDKIKIVADGGIKYPGDITKAIAAGAHAVMVGSLFAGTSETPGDLRFLEGAPVKEYRGMASDRAHQVRQLKENASLSKRTAEGVSTVVPFKGSVKDVMSDLEGGLRSGMSYCNASNIQSLRNNVQFIRVTSAGLEESRNRDLRT
jgi:IMP dehydrogenase